MNSKNKETCFHCGEDCLEESVLFETKSFCCNGCTAVYQILNGAGLSNYYSIENNPGISQRNKTLSKFDYLDDEDILNKLLEFNEGKIAKITLNLPQIHCSSCIWLLERLRTFQLGVISSRVNFLKREAYFTFNKEEVSLKEIVQLLTSIGYPPLITLKSGDERTNKQNSSNFYIKLGVAGFCFGNIMLLSFPEYLSIGDVTQSFQKLFGYLNFAFSLPVFFYSATDYFRSAYGSLKRKYFNIDVPITLGIFALFFRSVFDIFFGNGIGYMDSLSGFVFFLLIGKWFQNKTYDTLSFERDYKSYFPLSATLKGEKKDRSVLVDKLKIGDIIEIRNEELIPCDAKIISGNAKIDYSFVTGESEPINKKMGELVYAGGKQLGSILTLQIEKEVSQGYLTRLWNQEVFLKDKDGLNKNLVNKVSQYFTIIVILIAVISSVIWLTIDSTKVLNVFTAVLIVACPCALALTLPFTYGNVMRLLGNKGIYLRDADTVETLKNMDVIVFDKTGTITLNKDFKVDFVGEKLTDLQLIWIKSLTKHSAHPLSQAVFTYLNTKVVEINSFNEYPSLGLMGNIDQNIIKLGAAKFVGVEVKAESLLHSVVHVSVNEKYLGYFAVQKKYRDGLADLVKKLKLHYQVLLLSGDNDSESEKLIPIFEASNMLFNQSPEDKLLYIKQIQSLGKKVVMIGDGLNDAGALKQSDVGVAISDNIHAFSPSCDVILASENFTNLDKIFRFTKVVQRIVIASFIFSLTYNFIGLFIAVNGLLTPLFAAILMPLSSITVVLFVTLAVKMVSGRYVN